MADPLVLAVANHKGGVAKTASTLALAEAAVTEGLTVGLIDLDPNCTLTETLEPADLDAAGSKDLLRDDRDLSLADCLTPAGEQWAGVRVCLSDPLLSNREYDLTAPASEERLRESIKRDAGGVDLIIIDLPPARSRIALTGLVAADLVLIPTTATTYSTRSMSQMFEDFLPKSRRFNPELTIAGVLITKFAGRAEERRVLAELVEAYGELVMDPPIPRHEIVATAFESLHLPLRQMHDGYATKVADAYAEQLPHILAAGHTSVRKIRKSRR
jgi:chromosome partitioning protein